MRFEDDNGMIVALSPAARTLYMELKPASGRLQGYELQVYLSHDGDGWRSSFELYYAELDRALIVLRQLEELHAV